MHVSLATSSGYVSLNAKPDRIDLSYDDVKCGKIHVTLNISNPHLKHSMTRVANET